MDETEFKAYLDHCYAALESKQKLLMDGFSLGSFDQFELDLERQRIAFLSNGVVKIQGEIVPIGCFNIESQIWLWAWANEAYPEPLRARASAIKALKDKTGIEMFADKMANFDEPMAWEVVAMAVDILGAQGVYRSSADKTQYFLAVAEITRVK